jgi:hypothetical protein
VNEQPEALRLADALASPLEDANDFADIAAAKLRRLHAVNAELLEALKDAARCVQNNYMPDFCGHDWDEVIAKAEGKQP